MFVGEVREGVCRGDMGGCLYTVREVREGVYRGDKEGCSQRIKELREGFYMVLCCALCHILYWHVV